MPRPEHRWIGFLLCLLLGCGGGSGGGSVQSAQPLHGAEGAAASLRAALTLASVLSVLVLDAPAFDGAVTAASSGVPAGSRAVSFPCPLGGSAAADCRERGGETVASAKFSACAETLGERTLISSGGAIVTVEAPGLCGRPVPPGVAVRTELRDFSATVEAAGEVVDELRAPRLAQRFVPDSSAGCGGGDGVTTLSGRFSARRGAAIDVAAATAELVVDVNSRGNPCRLTATADGDLAVSDRARDNSLAVVLADFTLSSVLDSTAATLVAVDGAFAGECSVAAEVATEEMFPLDSACPTSGALAVALADGTQLRAAFSAAGVALDDGTAGAADAAPEACAAALPTCR